MCIKWDNKRVGDQRQSNKRVSDLRQDSEKVSNQGREIGGWSDGKRVGNLGYKTRVRWG